MDRQFATVERFGGRSGIVAAEAIFGADSHRPRPAESPGFAGLTHI
jgi:hypothetical protein